MKKIVTLLFTVFFSSGLLAKTVTIDPASLNLESTKRFYLPINHTTIPIGLDREHTFVFYVYPSLQADPSLKSDPIKIRCNDYELILAPGASFACIVTPNNPVLQWGSHPDYAHNGSDIIIMDVE